MLHQTLLPDPILNVAVSFIFRVIHAFYPSGDLSILGVRCLNLVFVNCLRDSVIFRFLDKKKLLKGYRLQVGSMLASP
jgi:hypothetical protein